MKNPTFRQYRRVEFETYDDHIFMSDDLQKDQEQKGKRMEEKNETFAIQNMKDFESDFCDLCEKYEKRMTPNEVCVLALMAAEELVHFHLPNDRAKELIEKCRKQAIKNKRTRE